MPIRGSDGDARGDQKLETFFVGLRDRSSFKEARDSFKNGNYINNYVLSSRQTCASASVDLKAI